MFKSILLTLASLALLATTAVADDVLDDVAGLQVASISDAQISIDDPTAGINVDSLDQQAGSEKGEQAIEACFRRFGYGGHGYGGGYCGYNYGCYGSHYGCYSPCYSYNHCYYQPVVSYRPVYYTTHHYQTFSYWGCY
jgi:opacity protein-like surface antigen